MLFGPTCMTLFSGWHDVWRFSVFIPYLLAVAPERIWKWGHRTGPERKWRGTDPAQSAGIFFCRVPPLFGSKSTISRFGERFCDGQYSLVSFLFAVLLLTVPPCRAICKRGRGARGPWLMESTPLPACVLTRAAYNRIKKIYCHISTTTKIIYRQRYLYFYLSNLAAYPCHISYRYQVVKIIKYY